MGLPLPGRLSNSPRRMASVMISSSQPAENFCGGGVLRSLSSVTVRAPLIRMWFVAWVVPSDRRWFRPHAAHGRGRRLRLVHARGLPARRPGLGSARLRRLLGCKPQVGDEQRRGQAQHGGQQHHQVDVPEGLRQGLLHRRLQLRAEGRPLAGIQEPVRPLPRLGGRPRRHAGDPLQPPQQVQVHHAAHRRDPDHAAQGADELERARWPPPGAPSRPRTGCPG